MHGVGDLTGARIGVADGGDHTGFCDPLDVARGFGPFGRKGHDSYQAARGLLPAQELVEVGRTHPLPWMCAARAILGAEVGAFNMKALDGLSTGYGIARCGKVAQAGRHRIGRAGDHGGKQARNAGGELCRQGTSDLRMRRGRIVVVHAGEAVDLKVNEPGSQPQVAGSVARRHRADGVIEGD